MPGSPGLAEQVAHLGDAIGAQTLGGRVNKVSASMAGLVAEHGTSVYAAPVTPLPPYARFLGISTRRSEAGELQFVMQFSEIVTGRPGYVHGGALAGLLEFAAFGALFEALGDREGVIVKPINVTVQYMRGAARHDTIAAATVTRLGKRVANVEAHAWQLDRAKPVAAAQLNVLLRRN